MKQPAAMTAGNANPANTGKTTTTDNSQLIAQKQSTTGPSKNFNQALGEKITAKTSQNAQTDKESKKQDQDSGELFKIMHHAEALVVQGTLTQPVVLDKAVSAKPVMTDEQVLPLGAETPVQGWPTRTVVFGKTVSAKPVMTDEQVLPLGAETPVQGWPTRTVVSDKTVSAKPVMTDELALPLDAETTVSTKPVITSTSLSNQQNQQSGKQSIPKTLISDNKTTADSEQSVVTNKSSVPDSSKTQLSSTPFTAAGDQSSHPRQKILIGQESPAQAVEKTTPNKADTDQKDHHGKTQLFELPEKDKVQAENFSVKSIAQKMSQPRVQLSASQVENRSNLLVNKTSNPNMELGEQVLLGNNAQSAITEPTPASATFAKITGNADSGDSVGEQIQKSIHGSFRSGSQQIVIRLNPPELGRVAIKFQEQAGDITGSLQVDKPQTRDQIQQVLPEIIQNLQDCGIGIKRLEVVLTNQQQQYTSKDQSSAAGQDSWSQQQSLPNPESQRNNTTYDEWLTSINNGTEFAETQAQLTDSSINMLI